MTTVGSSLFHLTRETKFFNLDNVFATSLLLITVWGFFLAIRDGKYVRTFMMLLPDHCTSLYPKLGSKTLYLLIFGVKWRQRTCWTGIWWYVVTIGLGGPVAVFFIVRCGMPGLVCQHPSGRGLCRKSNSQYDFFHMLWHLASGLGETFRNHPLHNHIASSPHELFCLALFWLSDLYILRTKS